MQWLSDLPFSDNRMVQIGFLVACGLAALVVLAILYRFVFAHRLRVPGGRTRQPRLGLVDAFSLDGQRQLVLVRRDNVEHLIMIGGPNDVLVESQINRALAAARENNLGPAAQSKPAPRPTEPLPAAPPVAATQVPAQVPAPPIPAAPAAAKGSAPQPPLAAPAARAVRGEVRPIRPQNVSLSPAPPAPEAPRPAAPVAPEPVAQPAPPAGASKGHEPAAHPIQSQPQPRPLPPRPAMPPPINPIAATARATVSPLPGRHIHSAPPVPSPAASPPVPSPAASPPVPSPAAAPSAPIPDAASGQHPGPEAPATAPPKEPARAVSAAVPLAVSAKATGTPVAPVPAAMIVKAEPKIGPSKPHGSEAPPSVDRQPTPPGADPSLIEKPPPKAQDPFGGLESLEAEMARLLGREKQG